jgi:hypothetical protein
MVTFSHSEFIESDLIFLHDKTFELEQQLDRFESGLTDLMKALVDFNIALNLNKQEKE